MALTQLGLQSGKGAVAYKGSQLIRTIEKQFAS